MQFVRVCLESWDAVSTPSSEPGCHAAYILYQASCLWKAINTRIKGELWYVQLIIRLSVPRSLIDLTRTRPLVLFKYVGSPISSLKRQTRCASTYIYYNSSSEFVCGSFVKYYPRRWEQVIIMGARTSWTDSTKRHSMWLALQVRHLHLSERNHGFIQFDILGFNYEFDALNPTGKPNELHQAFQKFKARQGSSLVTLLGAIFPALGPIFKIFVSAILLPFFGEKYQTHEGPKSLVKPSAEQLLLSKLLTASRINYWIKAN